MPRRHGFQWPWHPWQVLAWLFTALQICLNYLILLQVLSKTRRLVFLCLYTPTLVCVVLFGGILTARDSTDAVVIKQRKALAEGRDFPADLYGLICTACGTSVSPQSKHCARCDRCVAGFDHHCKWLNNCIGSCNYGTFWLLILSLLLSTGLQCAFTASVVAKAESLEQGLLGLHLAVTGVEFLGVTQLVVFHAWLWSQGQTTYEFIRKRRERIQPKQEDSHTGLQDSNLTTSYLAPWSCRTSYHSRRSP